MFVELARTWTCLASQLVHFSLWTSDSTILLISSFHSVPQLPRSKGTLWGINMYTTSLSEIIMTVPIDVETLVVLVQRRRYCRSTLQVKAVRERVC
ncbi:hypothetical protein F5148DRAFT_1269621 [Russula earlei]|uniref:Uncharacterized protein n=1 Tax=Russula earlei TaxID=71964 RepID=A0ACC0TQV6_9AGAM|nr:hypothetical protein F5148DRAFT_1269621 [Russula earlei]